MIPEDRHPRDTPSGPWVMVQHWHHLLFAHWRCPVHHLRALIPEPIDIETYDGDAWIGVIPFYMTDVRMRATPPVPTAGSFEELNVRTYVTLDGKPGIWFFSLDCASTLAVIGARVGMHLPYFRADMRMTKTDSGIRYESRRRSSAGPPATFAATYRAVGDAAEAPPGTLDHFLTERFCVYSTDGERIWRGDIYHPRWSLRRAEAVIEDNTLIAAAGLSVIPHAPLLHYSEFQDVRFWWPEQVR